MNIIQKHIAYLNDNPKNLWFKRKLYGFGWTPAKWQGWLTIAIFVALMIGNTIRFSKNASYLVDTVPVGFIIQTVILVILLIVVCYVKGEKPGWQWGNK